MHCHEQVIRSRPWVKYQNLKMNVKTGLMSPVIYAGDIKIEKGNWITQKLCGRRETLTNVEKSVYLSMITLSKAKYEKRSDIHQILKSGMI